MNFTYLDKAFQEDDRAVLLYPVDDAHNSVFIEVGSTVYIRDIQLNPIMQSGYSVEILLKNSQRICYVDKDILMPYKDWKPLYNKALELAANKARL